MSSDDNDKSTEQVLEYYKKYSQSKNLSKYFSGSSVAYLPSIDVENDEERLTNHVERSSKHVTSKINSATVSELKITVDEPKEAPLNPSSPESPSEHKKLEWDNGADIGYHSARRNSDKKLHKSSSLPILDNLTELKSLLTLKPSTIIAHSSSNENLGVLVFSSSSSSNQQSSKNSGRQAATSSSSTTPDNQKEQYLSTETSSNADVVKTNHSDSDETRFGEFQRSIDLIKHKIGLPGAQSTPNVADSVRICSSGSSKSSLPALGLNSKKYSQEKQKPCGGGAFSIEEFSKSDKRMDPSEKSSPSKPCSSSSSRAPTKNSKKHMQTKCVELTITRPINVNCRGINTQSSNKSVQSESEVTPKGIQTETVSSHHRETQFNFDSQENDQKKQRTMSVSDMADSASSFEYISAKKPAEGMVKSFSGVLKEINFSKSTTESSNVSQSGSEDIERYLQVLQKLCKAKKISSSTKRKYIRKLLRELSEIDTSNDSNASSDLFIPKKDKLKPKVAFKDTVDQPCVCIEQQHLNSGSNSSTSPTRAKVCIAASRLLQRRDAVEQDILSTSDHSRHSKASEKLMEDEVKCSENKLTTIACSEAIASEKAPSVDCKSSVVLEEKAQTKEDPLNKDKRATSCSRSNSTGDGSSLDDVMLKFAENERAYQLTWINNEINHLSKLKSLLEAKKSKPTSSSRSKISNYNVAQKSSSSERKYVIETNLDVPEQQPASYVLEGKEYVVTDSGKSSCDINRAVIEIDSDELQTNIRVSTMCYACKSVECVCPTKKSISAQMECPETCSKSQQMISVCAELKENIVEDTVPKTMSSTESSEEESIENMSLVDFNSLQKVFEKCCCTIENPNCGCSFVKKLLKKFQIRREQITDANEVNTACPKVEQTNTACQTNNLCQETVMQTCIPSTQCLAVQTLSDDVCKCTQTDPKQTTCTCESVATDIRKTSTSNSGDCQTRADSVEVGCECVTVKISKETASVDMSTKQFGNKKNGTKDCLPCKSTQTDQRRKLRDSCMCTCRSQTSNSIESQTKGKLSKSESVQVGCECVAVQMGKETVPTDVQTEQFGDKKIGTSNQLEGAQFRMLGDLKKADSSIDNIRSESFVSVKPDEQVPAKDVAVAQKGTQYTEDKEKSRSDGAIATQSRSGSTSTSTPTTSTTSRSSASSRIICYFCKQKAFLAEVSYLQQGNGDSLAVCSRCYYSMPRYCSHNPKYMCRCQTYWYPARSADNTLYCQCCRMEISKCLKRPKGLLYTVTLENGGSNRRTRKERIKVEKGWSGKNLKNKENYHKRDRDRKKEKRKKEVVDVEDKDDMTQKEKNKKTSKKDNVEGDIDARYTLMEYLFKNRPEFVCAAEYRRQMLLHSRIIREQQKDDLKLNFLENNLKNANEGKYKLFTEREMKDINKKNYKKLPEVQDKLINQRENRLKHADRLISNMFAKKVQKSVLQGRDNFPIDRPLTNL